MNRYRVIQIDTIVTEYMVEADGHDEAIRQAQSNPDFVPIRTKVIERNFETENLSLLAPKSRGK